MIDYLEFIQKDLQIFFTTYNRSPNFPHDYMVAVLDNLDKAILFIENFDWDDYRAGGIEAANDFREDR